MGMEKYSHYNFIKLFENKMIINEIKNRWRRMQTISSIALGWAVVTCCGLGTLILANKSIQRENVEWLKKRREEKKKLKDEELLMQQEKLRLREDFNSGHGKT